MVKDTFMLKIKKVKETKVKQKSNVKLIMTSFAVLNSCLNVMDQINYIGREAKR